MPAFFKSLCLSVMLLGNPASAYANTITPRIIGGGPANVGSWPWMAALIVKKPTLGSSGEFCGGSLIAPNWILTAGHCVYDETVNTFEVLVNSSQLQPSQSERITPKAILVHPNFDIKSLVNDLALVELSHSAGVTPIEVLPSLSVQDQAGQTGVALGWGNTSANTKRPSYPDTLHQVDLPIISNTDCKRSMYGIEDTMFCAGSQAGGKDTCDGDSGGPLLVFDTESNSWRLAGITSFGEMACAARGYYGVYTRLSKFNDFISATTCTANQIPEIPTLRLELNGNLATARWNTSMLGTHYRLNYAPYPYGNPWYSLEAKELNQFSAVLPKGSSYYVSITAYNGNCKSALSNVEHFTIQ